jgi:beta-glucosidase
VTWPSTSPFGHGLSYTSFDYDTLSVTVHELHDPIALTVTVDVTNTGPCAGAEVVQLYVGDHGTSLQAPVRELRAFKKIRLAPAQRKRVTLPVLRDDLRHFDTAANAWIHEGGRTLVEVGSSSRDVRASAELELPGRPTRVPLIVWSTYGEWLADPSGGAAVQAVIAARGASTVGWRTYSPTKPGGTPSSECRCRHCWSSRASPTTR